MNKVCCCSNPTCIKYGCQDKSQEVIPLTVGESYIPGGVRPSYNFPIEKPLTEADIRRIVIDTLVELGLIYKQACAATDTKQWPRPDDLKSWSQLENNIHLSVGGFAEGEKN